MPRRFLIALSFANLCYMPVWKRLLEFRSSAEFGMKDLPARAEYLAAICGVLLCALFFLGVHEALRCGPTMLRGIEIPFGLLLFALAVQSYFAGSELRVDLLHFAASLLIPLTLVALAGLILMGIYHSGVRRCAAPALLALIPFSVLTLGRSLYLAVTRTGLPDPTHARLFPRARRPRVLWVIFDGWDQRLTFDARPAGLALPAIDRIRSESLFATNALPPADQTVLSMSSFIEGHVVRSAAPIDARTMLLQYQDGGTQRLGDGPNLFSEVRRSGMNSAAYGWHLPYCRVFQDSLSDCWWRGYDAYWNSTGTTFFSALLTQPRSLLETTIFSPFGQSLTIQRHARTYDELLSRGKRAAADPNFDLTLVHFNVPHFPYFYDHASGSMTLANTPFAYPDALALVDHTIGELRASMEQAGTWSTTTILFSADHFFRRSPLVNGVRDKRIPFLIHFPKQTTSLSYGCPFNTVVTHDLILAMLHSEVADGASAEKWLDGRIR